MEYKILGIVQICGRQEYKSSKLQTTNKSQSRAIRNYVLMSALILINFYFGNQQINFKNIFKHLLARIIINAYSKFLVVLSYCITGVPWWDVE